MGIQFCQHVLFHRLLPPFSSFYTFVKHLLNICTRGVFVFVFVLTILFRYDAAAAAKLHQSCVTLCDPTDGSPPGSSVPGILQAKTLTWVAISFSNACMHVHQVTSAMSNSVPPYRRQPPRLLCPWDSPGKNTGVGCHFLLHFLSIVNLQCCVSGIQQFTRYLIQFPELYRRFLLFIYFIYILVCIYLDS